ATGVPVETLRTWERRYGFPEPVARVEAAHRRYPIATVERLRHVVKALEAGHKPSVVLRASLDVLRELVALTQIAERIDPGVRAGRGGENDVAPNLDFAARCLVHVQRLDAEGLLREFEQMYSRSGALEFLEGAIAPFLNALGDAWSKKQVEVAHEHFASEL